MNHAIEIALPQPQSEHGGKSPLDWKWPAAPALMTLFDKYSGRESVVRLADRHWEVFAAGSTVRLEFAEGQVGELQRALVLLVGGQLGVRLVQPGQHRVIVAVTGQGREVGHQLAGVRVRPL